MKFGQPILETFDLDGVSGVIMVIGKHQQPPSTRKLYEATLVICEYDKAPPEFLKNRYPDEFAKKVYEQYKLRQANIKLLRDKL